MARFLLFLCTSADNIARQRLQL